MDALREAFVAGFERYGDLDFDMESHTAHLRMIYARQAAGGHPVRDFDTFVASLHVIDVYLTFGCARQNARAWQLFAGEFHAYIGRLAAIATESDAEASELSDAMIVDLCLPDRSGNSRIGSFDGRSSLATWLRVLVGHRALNQRKRSRHTLQGVDRLPETVDDAALTRLDAELRDRRYGNALHAALRDACATLTERERLVLRLRFGEECKVQDIAAHLHVHPSNITRQIERVCDRLRGLIMRGLGERHHLSNSQIDECLVDVVENPRYSILALLEQTPPLEPCSTAETAGRGPLNRQ